MNIKSLLEQKRTKGILTSIYFLTSLVLLLLSWLGKIDIGGIGANVLLSLGILLWGLVRQNKSSNIY